MSDFETFIYGGISVLKGEVLSEIHRKKDEELLFITINGDEYRMNHHQDCCEIVEINDICGDLEDLIGSEILLAEQVSFEGTDSHPNSDGDAPGPSLIMTQVILGLFTNSPRLREV